MMLIDLLGQTCISTPNDVARALNMRIPKKNAKHDEAFQNRPDLTQILHSCPIQPIAALPKRHCQGHQRRN